MNTKHFLMPLGTFQLDLILELLGTPSMDDMNGMCEPAKQHVLQKGPQPSRVSALYKLSQDTDQSVVNLMVQMLMFNPVSMSANYLGYCLCYPQFLTIFLFIY